MIIPTAVFLPPALIAGPSEDGTSNSKSNSSGPSAMMSLITVTLTLLIVLPLANVAVSGVVAKSSPPVSKTLFSQHIIIYTSIQMVICQLSGLKLDQVNTRSCSVWFK